MIELRPLEGYSKLFESQRFELTLNCSPDDAIDLMREAMIEWTDYEFVRRIPLKQDELRDQGMLVRGALVSIRGHRFAVKAFKEDPFDRSELGYPYCIGTIVSKGSRTAVLGSIRFHIMDRVMVIFFWTVPILLSTLAIVSQDWVFGIPALVLFTVDCIWVPWRFRNFAGQWDQLAEDLQRMYSGVIVKEGP